MKIIDSLQPEDLVYDLIIESHNDKWYLLSDCKHRNHVNDHGSKYHYKRELAISDYKYQLETLKSVLEKYRKAI